MSNEPEQYRKVFIGGLSYKTTEEGLRGFYSQWGELLDAVVMSDKTTGKSRGFGFVTYSDSAMVDDAMKNRPHTIDGRTVQPKRAVPREESGNPGANVTVNKIFIGGLKDKPVTKEDLDNYFGVYGNIKDCVIMVEKETKKPRGFAFVEFDDYDPVDVIILKKYHEINGTKIDVKKALPRDGAAGDSGRGGSRGGGAATQRGGGSGRGGGRGSARGMGTPEFGSGGKGRGGYAKENSYNENDFHQNRNQGSNQGRGWNPNGGNGGPPIGGMNQGYDPSYNQSYDAGFGQPQQQQSGFGQQQQQHQQPNYEPAFNPDFGQNYGQSFGGGAMKTSMTGNSGYGNGAVRQAPYGGGYGGY